MRLLLRLLINSAALWVATQVVPGISFSGDWRLLLVVALVFGVLNVLVRPVLIVLTFPFLLLTLGLFVTARRAIGLGRRRQRSDQRAHQVEDDSADTPPIDAQRVSVVR